MLVTYLFGDWDDDCRPVSMRLTLDINDDPLPPTGQDVHLRGERGQVTVRLPADLEAADVLRVRTVTAEGLQGYSSAVLIRGR